MKWTLVLGIAVTTSCCAITLDEALETALSQNRQLELSRLTEQESTEKVHQAKSSFYPSIELVGGYARMSSVPFIQLDEDFGIPLGYYDNYSASINLSFPLFTSGKRRGAYRMALLGADLSREESQKAEYDLRETVYSSFYGLLVAQEGAKIARGAVERTEDHLTTVKTQHRRGLVSQLDLLRAEHFFSRAEAEYLRASNAESTARKALNLVLGTEIDLPTVAEGELSYEPVHEDVDLLLKRALEKRPEIRTLRLANQVAAANLSMARVRNGPNLVLSVGYSFERPYQFEDRWGRNLVTSLGLQLPLFDGFRNLSEIREAEIVVRRIRVQEELVQRAIRFEVEQAYLDLVASEAELSVQEKAVTQAEEALQAAEEQYEKGLISSLDYRDASFAFTSAEFSHLSTLYQYRLARVRLEKATSSWD